MNHVIVDGTVTRNVWNYNGDTLFRLSADGGCFFTIRCKGLPPQLKAGMRVVVVGKLISRDEDVNLSDFVRRAEGGQGKPDPKDIDKLAPLVGEERRSYTEILADELLPIQG